MAANVTILYYLRKYSYQHIIFTNVNKLTVNIFAYVIIVTIFALSITTKNKHDEKGNRIFYVFSGNIRNTIYVQQFTTHSYSYFYNGNRFSCYGFIGIYFYRHIKRLI